MDVFVKFQPEDDFCGARKCNVSYAISLLTAQSQFDLQSMMLQDGVMERSSNDVDFEENTIIRVAKNLPEESKVFLGLRLFDVPDDIQGNFIIFHLRRDSQIGLRSGLPKLLLGVRYTETQSKV